MNETISISIVISKEDERGGFDITGALSAENGWSQWGESKERLGANVDLMEALQFALFEHQ